MTIFINSWEKLFTIFKSVIETLSILSVCGMVKTNKTHIKKCIKQMKTTTKSWSKPSFLLSFENTCK